MAVGPLSDQDIEATLRTRYLEPVVVPAWRVVWDGDPPLQGSDRDGRWTPLGVSVLYTSLLEDGALAEIGLRVFRQPAMPDRPHRCHRIEVTTNHTLRIESPDELSALGVDIAAYKNFDYHETQRIASIAYHQLGADSLIVPCARWECSNLVLFLDRLPGNPTFRMGNSTRVDWDAFKPRYDSRP
jgi:RES domain-containing protein